LSFLVSGSQKAFPFDTTRLLVVVHRIRPNPVFARPNESSIVRDHLLNRILTDQLEGDTVNTIRLIVTDASGSGECRRKDSGFNEISTGLRIRKKAPPPERRRGIGSRWNAC
jgi:hypothetical protein